MSAIYTALLRIMFSYLLIYFKSSLSSFCGYDKMNGQFHLCSTPTELLFIVQMFTSRENDDGAKVTQYLGSCVIDISQCSKKEYHLTVRDSSNQPPILNGWLTVQLIQLPRIVLQAHSVQTPCGS